MTLDEFERYLHELPVELEKQQLKASEANANLIRVQIKQHIVADDLPVPALSDEWLRYKRSHGFSSAHLAFTLEYLGNFETQPIDFGFETGTLRDADGFPTTNWQSLPELLEDHYPVWEISLDKLEAALNLNFAEGADAALERRTARFREV